ncbi:hypothetical protein H5410_039828 [Solanum commersonii]|uniref:Uncharacterized protein n=1 Tax=Solanum commersonii TaxID=4109 RepID=A0A9J5XNB0_SOLCO|nr:hypothetical protein H5410_039828 [Solanum commersonii]
MPSSWILVRRNYVGDGGFEKAIYVDYGEPKTTTKQWSERERRHWSVERRTRYPGKRRIEKAYDESITEMHRGREQTSVS